MPEEVKELKKKIRGADAILFATPEHNYSITAVLKNAIEWVTGRRETLRGAANLLQSSAPHRRCEGEREPSYIFDRS